MKNKHVLRLVKFSKKYLHKVHVIKISNLLENFWYHNYINNDKYFSNSRHRCAIIPLYVDTLNTVQNCYWHI